MQAAIEIIRETDAASALIHPMRRRILQALEEPGSATTVARTLGLPRQKVNYHVRTLEESGLVEHVRDQQKGNCTERIVQATARHYLISPTVTGAAGTPASETADRHSSAHLAAVAARTVAEVGELRSRAAAAEKRLPTMSLETAVRFSSPEDQAAFTEELSNTVARLVAQYHDEGAAEGRWFRFLMGAHPALTVHAADRPDSNPMENEE